MKRARVFGQQTLCGAKRWNWRLAKKHKQKLRQPRKAFAETIARDSAPLHWFKLAAGINGILPAWWRALPFIPLLP
jgi:hypothetical protein